MSVDKYKLGLELDIELNVPFVEKDQAKSLGARWNAVSKKWFVPSGIDPKPFVKWCPDNVVLSEDFSDIEQNKNNNKNNNNISLLNFLNNVSIAIANALPRAIWISAEISECRANNGNLFLSLVEHNTAGSLVAKARAMVWQGAARSILSKFEQGTGSTLEPGIKVLVLVKAEFHVNYGFSLFIEDIDPSYTLGDMAAKLAKIKDVLEKEQLLYKNKNLIRPQEYTRLAVISPEGAAGLGDFQREASLLEKYNLCEFVYFYSVFQGKDAGAKISAAIEQVIDVHLNNKFDALIIIRGGGAVSDLAWLNEEQLARKICLCPMSVMVGIGHERDYTILDEVAGERFDTPSKVIQRVFNVITRNAENAENNYREINKTYINSIKIFSQTIENDWSLIKDLAESKLFLMQKDIVRIMEQLQNQTGNILRNAIQQVDYLIREILGQDPKSILKKGFAMVSTTDGKIISSQKQALDFLDLKIKFYDGDLRVKSVN